MSQDITENPTKSVRTPVLEIAYEERGAPEDPPVVLVHGFPDDARSWDAVSGTLAAAGYRTLAPYLRGFGPTRFLDDDTPRSGQPAALAQDLIDFTDALDLEHFTLVGHDWGATAAQSVAALRPERVERLVSFLGYSISWDTGSGDPPSYSQLHALWYQFVLNTDLGAALLSADSRGLCRYLWEAWSPTWSFSDREFEAAAISFENPDFIEIVLHAYRYGSPFGPSEGVTGDPRYDGLEQKLSAGPPVPVPTILLQGSDDGLEPDGPGPSPSDRLFIGGLVRRVVQGIGHFPHRERPYVVAEAALGDPAGPTAR